MKSSRWWAFCVASALACVSASCSSSSQPAAGESAPPPKAPAGYNYSQPMARTNPRVVEETPAYFVERYKKAEVIRVDETHIRLPYASVAVPIYREDADYYYLRTEKISAEEERSAREEKQHATKERAAENLARLEEQSKSNPLVLTPEQFDTLVPRRSSKTVVLRRSGEGLPASGQWRENIAVADIDGDGSVDVVATPSRLSGGSAAFHLYLGDGTGRFREQHVDVVDAGGRPVKTALAYGAAAVGDFDGDRRPDVAIASHGQTVRVFLNRGNGKFQLDTDGLPSSFSSQAIAVFDVDGDGRLDMVASQDMINNDLRKKTGRDTRQVRVFLNQGGGRWKASPELQGACFSFNVFSLDLEGQGKRDLLTGCRSHGEYGLTWKNDGKGTFSQDLSDLFEQAAYHFAVAPGTFGPSHSPAFAELYGKQSGGLRAGGLNVYSKDPQGWHKVAVWRQKAFVGRLTSVAMGDLDGDGLDDIVFPDRTAGKVRIFFQTPAGTFEEAAESSEAALDSPVADTRLVDLNRDGRLDVVLAKTVFSELPKDPGGFEVLLNEAQ